MTATRKLNVQPWPYQADDDRYSVALAKGGKPVEAVQSDRITSVDETVMEWSEASHIHAWFVENVQDGKDDRKTHVVPYHKLRELLTVCDKVLYSSHLVPTTDYRSRRHEHDYLSTLAVGSAKVIKNVNVAHSLLPRKDAEYRADCGGYDEAYVKAIEDTRAWTIRMLTDERSGVRGNIHYASR